MEKIFYKIFESLPQQGPGDDSSTEKAFKLLSNLPAKPEILDIGCGSGRQTITLARISPGSHIAAVDLHGPFIDLLKNNVLKSGYADRATCLVKDMSSLDFATESFDIIWSEGAAYSIGFLNAVFSWNKFLKPGGYMVLSELVWKRMDRPQEIRKFFATEYSDMKFYKDLTWELNLLNRDITTGATPRPSNYTPTPALILQDNFFIPDESWWTGYYKPLADKIDQYRKLYPDDTKIKAVLDGLELEIDMHTKYADYYGYAFYILKK